ncbi:MAG: tetratricopeptide repeat protein [Planctomycetota bacterium]
MVDLGKHLENAADAVKRRNYPLAVKIYSQVLQIQPDYGEAREGLRKALFQKAAQQKPSKLTAVLGGGVHLLTGHLLKLCGGAAGAAKAFERYLAFDPLSEGANLALAQSLEKAGHRKSALAVYQTYAQQQPRCIEAARAAGALLYEAGRLNEALEMYETALKVDPRDQESLKARKNLAAEGALKTTGIETAQSSRELIKDKKLAQKLEQQTRLQLSPEELAQELKKAEAELSADASDPTLLRRAARLREQNKDLPGALELIERAVQGSPGDVELQDLCGELRLRLQEKLVQKALARGDGAAAEAAERALNEAKAAEMRRRVERNPADFALRYQLGEALLHLGDHDAAIAELQQAVKDPRKKAEAQFLLGKAFRGKNLPDLALGQFEKALQAAGTGPLQKDALYEMGALCEQLGKRDVALQHFGRILEQDIGYRDVAKRVDQLKAS